MPARRWLAGLTLGTLVFCAALPAGADTRSTIGPTLNRVGPQIKFDGVPLSEAIAFIRDSTNININVDWKSLEVVNIDRNTLINVRLHDVTLRKALEVILGDAGAGNLLTFYVEENVLEITTQAKADSILYTMVYPVKDLLMVPPNFSINDVSGAANALSQNTSSGQTYGPANAAGGSSAFNSGAGQQQQSNSSNIFGTGNSSATPSVTSDQQGQALVKLIMDTIRPEIWRTNGGNSSCTIFQGNLIVTAPLSVQEAIGGPTY